MLKKHMILLLMCASLTACGTMPEDRAISGAGIGAAGGAIIGAVTGLTVLEGAAIGAATGALTGVLTDKDKVNMGKPAWKQDDTASSSPTSAAPVPDNHTAKAANPPAHTADLHVVKEIQSGLVRLGYDPGPVDGINGERTRKAIRVYQEDHGLLVDGHATVELAKHIRAQSTNLGEQGAKQTRHLL